MLRGVHRDAKVGFGERFVFAMLLLSSFVGRKGTDPAELETFATGGSVQETPFWESLQLCSLAPVLKKVKSFLQHLEALAWLWCTEL